MGQSAEFDAIVVGAGPAGATAAYHLAKRGFNVLLVERGRGAGSKQVFGGRIYAEPLREVFDDLDKAPIHRWVRRERFTILDGERELTLDFRAGASTSFTAYLTQFTQWIAQKAVDAGAVLADEVRVDGLWLDGGRVRGIVAGPDRVSARVVVVAEGVNRLLLERAGFVPRASPRELALGVKEVIKLDKKTIEERFGLEEGEGLAWVLLGEVTDFIPGGAFVYTNRDTLSVGLVVHLGGAYQLLRDQVHVLAERLRTHPRLSRFFEGGDIMEYSAHMTIEDSVGYMPEHFAYNGMVIVGDAAGLLLNTGLTIRGVDYAAYSGYLAAKGVERALSEGEASAEALRSHYEVPLRESFIYRDLMRHRGASYAMKNPRMFREYPKVALDTLEELYTLGRETPLPHEALARALSRNRVGFAEFALRMLKVVMSL